MVRIRLSLVLVIGAAIIVPRPGFAQNPPPDSYLDREAGVLVKGARSGGASANDEIEAYEMVARQRVSLGLEARRRDRLLFRREIASRVTWTRGEGRRSEILGARQVVPVAFPGVAALDSADFARGEADLAIDPAGGWLLRVPFRGLGQDPNRPVDPNGAALDGAEPGGADSNDDGGDDFDEIIHPLSPGSESHYRFRTGGSTTIRLADGREIRLIELQVLPRRARPQLLNGSFWLDASTNAPVRGVFSLAAPATLDLDMGGGLLSFGVGSATIRYLTVEYGFWDDRWWLPRLISFEGIATLRSISVPVVLEQRYEDYTIHTATNPWVGFPEPDTARYRVIERECEDGVTECPPRTYLVPRDTTWLVESPELPPSIYDGGRWLTTERELDELATLLGASRWRGFANRSPRFYWHPVEGRVVHYNRVEGLTIGTGVGIELAPLSASAAAWLGTADPSPGFEFGVARSRLRGAETLTAYRRAEAFAPDENPFSLGNSLSAFLFGTDGGDYFRVLGVDLSSEHELAGPLSARFRGYVERHATMEKSTDSSVPNWLDGSVFRENLAADPADQVGGEVDFAYHHGLDPRGFRLGARVDVRGEIGTFDFVRPGLALYSTFPLLASHVGALEVAAGTSLGTPPVQRLWYIGGPASVRGFRPTDRVVGTAFWTARAELGTEMPGVRLVLFSDAGWAGDRSAWSADPTLISAGVGVSFLDGFVRADLARALRGSPNRWSFQLQLDAPL